MTTPTVSAEMVTAFLEYAISRGASREALLESAQRDASHLDAAHARVPLEAYLAIVRTAGVHCGDPAIALHYGVAIACAQQSVVGSIGATAATPVEAVAQLNRFARLNLDAGLPPGTDRFALEPARGALWMIDRRPDPNRSPEVTESVFARFATSLRRLSARPVLRRVLVTHAAPAHAATYDAVFGVPVRFSAGRNALELEPWWATFALPPQPRHLRPILEAHAEEALAALDAAATWHGRVAALVTTRLGTDDVHVESISRALGMSRQTLFRRLQGEGTTYAAVLDGVRRRAAEALMTDPRVPVKQVAARTGFSDPAAFSRAYRRWTGRPPSAGRAGSTGYVAGATGRRPS